MTVQELLADEGFWKAQIFELEALVVDCCSGDEGRDHSSGINLFIQQLRGHANWVDKGRPKFGTPEYWEKMKPPMDG